LCFTRNVETYQTCNFNDTCGWPYYKHGKINDILGQYQPDVCYVQEDWLNTQNDQFNNYTIVYSCYGEELDSFYLANKIYVRNDLIDVISNPDPIDINDRCTVPKCASTSTIRELP